jgi:hypothetical protein
MLIYCKLDNIGLTAFVLMLKKEMNTGCTFFGTLFIQVD